MKWLFLILGYFLRPLARMSAGHAEPPVDFKQLMVENAKKALLALTLTSLISSLFVGGAVITVITLAAQYDQNGAIGLSAMLIGGFSMMVLSTIIAWIIFSPARESKEQESRMEERQQAEAATTSAHPGLSDALVMLINDFIKEREFKRAKEAQMMDQQAQNPESAYYGGQQNYYRSKEKENRRDNSYFEDLRH